MSRPHVLLSAFDAATQRRMIEELSPEERARILSYLGLGTSVLGAGSVEEALQMAGADFEVGQTQLQALLPKGEVGVVPGRKALFRSDNHDIIGDVAAKYGVLQNRDAFAPAQVMVERGELTLISCWQERNGAVVGLEGLIGATSLELPGADKPDTLCHVLSLKTSHDGSTSREASLNTVRLVCLNGVTVTTPETTFKVRHTSKVKERLAEADRVLLKIQTAARDESELYAALTGAKMTEKEFRTFAEDLLNEVRVTITDETTDAIKERRQEEIKELTEFFLHGQGNHGATKADGWNAVTEWLTPRRERYEHASQFNRAMATARTGNANRVRAAARRRLMVR